MKPGKKLDALVAEKVMGWKRIPIDPSRYGIDWMWDKKEGCLLIDSQECPKYSTDISAAWQVVEKMFQDAWSIQIEGSELIDSRLGHGGFDVRFNCKCGARGRFDAEGDTLPVAVCLAALKTVKNEAP